MGRRIINNALVIILFLSFGSSRSLAQFYSYYSDLKTDLQTEFLKPKIEISPDKSLFNIFRIVNNSTQPTTFQLNFSIPETWSLMNEEDILLSLDPNDTVNIPIRASLSRNVKGEIGYVVVATLSDEQNRLIKNDYCFVNVPKETDLSFKIKNRTEYFDPGTKSTSISFSLRNRGNIDELIYIEIDTDQEISVEGEVKNYFTDDIALPSNRDTAIEYKVLQKFDVYNSKSFFKVKIKASTKDTSFSSTIWVKSISNTFKNVLAERYYPLIFEFSAANLFTLEQPTYGLNLNGFVLLKNNRDIFYYSRINDVLDPDFFKYSETYIGYKGNRLNVKLGDIRSKNEFILFGKGIDIEYNLDKLTLNTTYTTSLFYPESSLGFTLATPIIRSVALETGGGYLSNFSENSESYVGFLSARSKLFNNFSAFARGSLVKRTFNSDLLEDQFGYGSQFSLGGYVNKFRVNVIGRYGSDNYVGSFRGLLDLRANAIYQLRKSQLLNFNYYNRRSSPTVIVGDSILPKKFNYVQDMQLTYSNSFSPGFLLRITPFLQSFASNTVGNFPGNEYFGTLNPGIISGLRLRIMDTETYFLPLFKYTLNNVTNYSDIINGEQVNLPPVKPFSSVFVSLGLRFKYWGFTTTYIIGPTTVNQQYNYFRNGINTRSLRVLPYFDRYIYKNIIKLNSRVNFVSQLSDESLRFNISNEIKGEFGNGWTISFLNTFSYQSIIDRVTEEKLKYNATYFELRVRKMFDFKQPRIKFYDLNLSFYRDMNGNNRRDENEPGIKNVLVEIQRDEYFDARDTLDYEYGGEFVSFELLSDNNGKASYKKIPEGMYSVKYTPLGEGEHFSAKATRMNIYIDKDKNIQIPFFETNKIYGRVILKRSKLSNLGTIDVSNIKVTATDRMGKVTSTLTDVDGNFVLYVPDVDKYIVSINNIFYQNFDLQQNNFEVQLNGYKQFELAFIFEEKRRRIRFSRDYEEDMEMEVMGIDIVRRTNVRGVIKDATDQRPIRAEVKVLNENERVVSSTFSDGKTGIYNLSFVAGENYKIAVSADNYWFFQEKLYDRQITTFQNIKKDVLLKSITVGSLIPLNNLVFGFLESDLSSQATAELDRLIEVLRTNPTVRVTIHGHADDLEVLEDTETDYSLERAKMVAKYLVANGYSRIEYVGHQNTKPVASNDTEEDRRKNRRVEIIVKSK